VTARCTRTAGAARASCRCTLPGRPPAPPYGSLLAGGSELDQYAKETGRRVDAVTDDRPFFFARYMPFGLPRSMMVALSAVLAPVALLALVFVVIGRPRGGDSGGAYAASVVYFACLGAGFIALELALLQHLTLLLGHPIFTLSVILFTLLASGGLGAGLSGRFALTPDGQQLWVTNELSASVTVLSTKDYSVVDTLVFAIKGARASDINFSGGRFLPCCFSTKISIGMPWQSQPGT